MDDATRYAVVAALAILAVAFAAATLDSAVESGPGGQGDGGGFGDGGPGGLLPIPEGGYPSGTAYDVTLPRAILGALLVLAAIAMAVYALLYPREVFWYVLQGLAIGAVFAAVLALLYLLVSDAGEVPTGDGSILGGLAGGGGDAASPSLSPAGVAVILVTGLAIVAMALALVRESGGSGDEPVAAAGDVESRSVAVGRAAGRAADRIEGDADVDNEVYRAWREMTALLDVDEPQTTTPGDFAAAAVETGLGRADVDELTRLFEDVRYGGRDPAPGDEQRAVATFRRIEARYAEAEA